jgi:hypothetical protein
MLAMFTIQVSINSSFKTNMLTELKTNHLNTLLDGLKKEEIRLAKEKMEAERIASELGVRINWYHCKLETVKS